MNTMLSAGAASPLQGHSLFPNIFKYNKGHNDSINKSKQNKLKGTQWFTMKQFSQMHTLLIGNLWQFGIRVPWNLTSHVLWAPWSCLGPKFLYFLALQTAVLGDCSGSPMVETVLPLQGVQLLIWELGSHRLCGQKRKKKFLMVGKNKKQTLLC